MRCPFDVSELLSGQRRRGSSSSSRISLFRGQFEDVDANLDDGALVGTARVESVKTAIPDLHGHLLSTKLVDRLQEARIYGSARAPPLANHNHFGGE